MALLRGSDWLAADRSGYLIVRTQERQELSEPTHADVLTINPFLKTAVLNKARGQTEIFSLTDAGSLAVLPRGTLHSSIATLGVPAVRGIIASEDFATLLNAAPDDEPVLIAGHCGWFEEAWCASPLGYRNARGLWTHFMTTGGAGGLAFDVSVSDDSGIALSAMARDTTEVQYFAMLAEAFITRFPQLPQTTLVIDAYDTRSAAMLVVARKAVGPYALRVTTASEEKLTPPWKRLLEHLNGVWVAKESTLPIVSLTELGQLVPAVDLNLLIQQINRHSQVIPHGMLTSR